MMNALDTLLLGTRGSDLALTQTRMVTEALQAAHPGLMIHHQIIHTAGDKRPDLRFAEFNQGDHPIVDKGIFIKELEVALAEGRVQAAVHSLKDVPSELEPQFVIAAVLPRAAIEDVLITREPCRLESLPAGSRVGTSSVRRARQLKWLRPDLEIVEIRGNVPTRVRKVLDDEKIDAVMLAAAGLHRLGMLQPGSDQIRLGDDTLAALVLDPGVFLPAAGQGAVAIETRSDHSEVRTRFAAINDETTFVRVTAEREFLRLLGAGCQTPVGAHTWVEDGRLHMRVRVFNEMDETAAPVEIEGSADLDEATALAADLAGGLIADGED